MCKECLKIIVDYRDSNALCFFHITTNIIFNKDFEIIKKWINDMLKQFKPYYQVRKVDYYNNTRISTYNFRNLLYDVYPRILKQKTIHKKNNIFVSNVTNYILSMAIEENITIYTYIFNTYLKYVKINVDILDKLKFLFKEKHFFNCINIQGLSLNKSLFYCYSLKKANDIESIINFYRDRDRFIITKLYHLPIPIVSLILYKIG